MFCFLFSTHIRLCTETWGNKSGQFKICFRIPLHLFPWNPASKTILDHAYGKFLQIQKYDSSPWTPFLRFTLASTSLNPVSNQRNIVEVHIQNKMKSKLRNLISFWQHPYSSSLKNFGRNRVRIKEIRYEPYPRPTQCHTTFQPQGGNNQTDKTSDRIEDKEGAKL